MSKHKKKFYLWSVKTHVNRWFDLNQTETPNETTKDALRVATGCSRKEVEEWQKEYSAENYN